MRIGFAGKPCAAATDAAAAQKTDANDRMNTVSPLSSGQ
jgi:hypothetical protein